jgi:hypothetical protein
MLTFEEESIKAFVDEHNLALNSIQTPNGWGCGPIVGNFVGLQGIFFKLLGRQARMPGQYRDPVIKRTRGETVESIHPVVRFRRYKIPGYDPPALQGFKIEEPAGRFGCKWTKESLGSIPEYVMDRKRLRVARKNEKTGVMDRFGSMESFSRQICPKDVLRLLDMENEFHA